MKFLIWLFALGIPSYITFFLNKIGIHIGGFFPTLILYGISILVAMLLCEKWEKYCINKAASKLDMTPFEYVKSQTPKVIIDHLESEKSAPEELKAFLDNYVKSGSIKKVYADILIEGYQK